jgi:hypothetical protein
MIDTLYQSTDYAYLHADKFIDDTANGNWGFIDIYGSTSGIGDAFANQTLGLSMTLGSTIENQTGFNAGNIINPIEERMQKANLLPEKEDRIRYMSGLVPIIDWEHRIVQGAQIQLPIKYFAVFEIYDVIVSEAQNVNQKSQGSKYALYDKPDYKYDPNHLVAKEYDKVGGEALAKATIIGKFTGEIVDIIAVPQPGDQNPPIPGVISPTYALLIE